jgi:hypothetical protein
MTRSLLGITAANLLFRARSSAVGALMGAFIVRCQNGHDNTVNGVTVTHKCETPGCGLNSVVDGGAFVVCPRDRRHRPDWCDGITKQHECETCGQQCRLD